MFFETKGYWVPSKPAYVAPLAAGAVLIVLFSFPKKNPILRLLMGVLGNSLSMVSAFSDTMSYIRLMAVGMAGGYIAYSTNLLGSMVADSATWAVGWVILVFGHGLNIVLVVIAIFAHGVRLNMLEFSNNAGVQWGGYAFRPFRKLLR
jgi:V/A-type H+-transporting ATPase subunit I